MRRGGEGGEEGKSNKMVSGIWSTGLGFWWNLHGRFNNGGSETKLVSALVPWVCFMGLFQGSLSGVCFSSLFQGLFQGSASGVCFRDLFQRSVPGVRSGGFGPLRTTSNRFSMNAGARWGTTECTLRMLRFRAPDKVLKRI